MDKLAAGFQRDALAKLVQLYKDDPGHLFGRIQLFTVALTLKMHELIGGHPLDPLVPHAERKLAEIDRPPESTEDDVRTSQLFVVPERSALVPEPGADTSAGKKPEAR
jgi:hypothetical protein